MKYEYDGYLYKASIERIIDDSREKDVFLYGYGLYGHFMEHQLTKEDIKIAGIIVSSKNYKEQILLDESCEFEIYNIDEFQYKENDVVIVCGNQKNAVDMSEKLNQKGIKKFYKFELEIIDKQIKPVEGEFTKEDCYAPLDNMTIRLRITNRCPSKCDFCGQKSWSQEFQNIEMDPKLYYEYLTSIYDKIKVIQITGGDAFYAKNSYDYMNFISTKYPNITIRTESNGLTFDDKFQILAARNLFMPHFSINASNQETFTNSCWVSEGGEKAWSIIQSNMNSFMELLRSEGKQCFSPSISMVVNKSSACDVTSFVEYALKNDFRQVGFYFDYITNNMESDYFKEPEVFRPALITLLELERLLKGYYTVSFRLWVPLKEIEIAEQMVVSDKIELRRKYSSIWGYASDRSTIREYEERERLRKEFGKKSLTYDEDVSGPLRTKSVFSNKTCFSPWNFLDFWPDGRMDICGWRGPAFFVQDYVTEDKVDWMKFFNSEEIRTFRANMLNDCFENCMSCCPIIKEVKEK